MGPGTFGRPETQDAKESEDRARRRVGNGGHDEEEESELDGNEHGSFHSEQE